MSNLKSVEAQVKPLPKKVLMYQQIEQHGKNLNVIFNTGIEPVALCKKLHRLEKAAHKLATDYCNGENGIDSTTIDSHTQPIIDKVNKLLNNTEVPIFFNGDARGYSLKIDDKYAREHQLKIHTDFGGYGIICPEYSGD